MPWTPPGNDCGSCGLRSCDDFLAAAEAGTKVYRDCPYYIEDRRRESPLASNYTGTDVLGQPYDFVLMPIPGEVSARKYVLPFRPDMTERYDIKKGDIVTGRPAGAGCPVQHVLSVVSADHDTGLIVGHVVSPDHARKGEVKNVKEYHMIGFLGSAKVINNEPQFGRRQFFLPGSCMMHRAHTGLVAMVIEKPYGLQVKIDNIIIL